MFFNKSKKLLQEKERELEQAIMKIRNYEKDLQEKNSSLVEKENKLKIYNEEFKDLIDKNSALAQKNSEMADIERKLSDLNETYQKGLILHKAVEEEIALYQDTLDISSYGLHMRQFSFDTSEKYKYELELNYDSQKRLIKADGAVICNTEWTVGGSIAEGKRMTNQYKKLMLFAFNGECDGLISRVKWNNATKTKEKITKSFTAINKLGVSQNAFISSEFLELKLQELALTYEYEQKKYEEKEEQRLIREQMREEERAQRELEKARKEAEDEERRFQKALDKAKQELQGGNSMNASMLAEQITELERKLQEAHEKKERAIAQAQLTKVGHIYVISNVGSFGEDVYKIGMTRRLDPLDRVRELGDASVPFQFDVHAIIYSENAPQLEYELHKRFAERRLNKVNHRKEFFRISLDEIESFVKEHANAEIEFTKLAEAREYRETVSMLKQVEEIIEQAEGLSKFPQTLT
jgi:hypothetical protein